MVYVVVKMFAAVTWCVHCTRSEDGTVAGICFLNCEYSDHIWLTFTS